MSASLGELAVRYGCELRGDPDVQILAAATLEAAGAGNICFVASAQYRDQLRATKASAVILDRKLAGECSVAALISSNPHATFARIATELHPEPREAPGVDSTAWVAADAQVDASAHIGPFASIGSGVRIGARCSIGPHCVLGAGAVLADDVTLAARVVLGRAVQLGARVIVQPGAVIGGDGFGYARDATGWVKVPQLGTVLVAEDVEIGANTTIDRGALGDTVIEAGVKLDNQIQVGHNVRIGAHTAIAACTGISGSTTIGKRCMIGGGTGIAGHITLGDDIVITGFGMITRSLDKPGLYSSVIPVEEARSWRRIVARLKRIDSMATRLTRVERAAGVQNTQEDEEHG
ncbi:MAG: UDP-3-O-(3-hydroxymyristoyl)glucosamine N-acyltransferase [Steroidobacteraceae bacterium]